MKWELVVMVVGSLGTTPVETGLVYDDIEKCYLTDKLRQAETIKWMRRVREASEGDTSPATEADLAQAKALIGTFGFCIPHS